MGLFRPKELSARDKIRVLCELNDLVRSGTLVGEVSIRALVSQVLGDCGYYRGARVGGELEISVTQELARYGEVAKSPEGVEAWAETANQDALVQTIVRTIDCLK